MPKCRPGQVMGLTRIDAVPENAPQQYALNDRCRECGGPLSRYNPYVVCGACRVRISARIAPGAIDAAECECHTVACTCGYDDRFPWERFPKRKPVRRGALLPDTYYDSGWGGKRVTTTE
jgi:hypothetical protein